MRRKAEQAEKWNKRGPATSWERLLVWRPSRTNLNIEYWRTRRKEYFLERIAFDREAFGCTRCSSKFRQFSAHAEDRLRPNRLKVSPNPNPRHHLGAGVFFFFVRGAGRKLLKGVERAVSRGCRPAAASLVVLLWIASWRAALRSVAARPGGSAVPLSILNRLFGKRSASGRRLLPGSGGQATDPVGAVHRLCPVGGGLVHGGRDERRHFLGCG